MYPTIHSFWKSEFKTRQMFYLTVYIPNAEIHLKKKDISNTFT